MNLTTLSSDDITPPRDFTKSLETSNADLTIFVPTRDRPDALNQFGTEFEATKRGNTKCVFVIDEDDPKKGRYISRNLLNMEIFYAQPSARGMNGALNQAFRHYYRSGKVGYAIGFMGDDHRPRTVGWDNHYLAVLRSFGTGFVYGNDLFQGHRLPTQVAFTTDIGAALTYMAPPVLHHLMIYNFWLDMGITIRRIEYLPDVIVEHMHPLAGKGQYDKAYRAVNSNPIVNHDAKAYRDYKDGPQFREDVGKLEMLKENGYIEPWD